MEIVVNKKSDVEELKKLVKEYKGKETLEYKKLHEIQKKLEDYENELLDMTTFPDDGKDHSYIQPHSPVKYVSGPAYWGDVGGYLEEEHENAKGRPISNMVWIHAYTSRAGVNIKGHYNKRHDKVPGKAVDSDDEE